MPKALCITGTAVAVLLLILFGFDLFLGFPFKSASKSMDIAMTISALILGYVSWMTLREQV